MYRTIGAVVVVALGTVCGLALVKDSQWVRMSGLDAKLQAILPHRSSVSTRRLAETEKALAVALDHLRRLDDERRQCGQEREDLLAQLRSHIPPQKNGMPISEAMKDHLLANYLRAIAAKDDRLSRYDIEIGSQKSLVREWEARRVAVENGLSLNDPLTSSPSAVIQAEETNSAAPEAKYQQIWRQATTAVEGTALGEPMVATSPDTQTPAIETMAPTEKANVEAPHDYCYTTPAYQTPVGRQVAQQPPSTEDATLAEEDEAAEERTEGSVSNSMSPDEACDKAAASEARDVSMGPPEEVGAGSRDTRTSACEETVEERNPIAAPRAPIPVTSPLRQVYRGDAHYNIPSELQHNRYVPYNCSVRTVRYVTVRFNAGAPEGRNTYRETIRQDRLRPRSDSSRYPSGLRMIFRPAPASVAPMLRHSCLFRPMRMSYFPGNGHASWRR